MPAAWKAYARDCSRPDADFRNRLAKWCRDGRRAEFVEFLREQYRNEPEPWIREPGAFALPPGSTASILCRGDSLRSTWRDGQRADVVIAVNTAINLHAANWLVAYDMDALIAVREPPGVGILSRCGYASKPWGWKRGRDIPVVEVQDVNPPSVRAACWAYSVLGAIALAGWLGAERIRLYGDDKAGRGWIDAPPNPQINTDIRWLREMVLQEMVTEYMSSEGIAVERVLP